MLEIKIQEALASEEKARAAAVLADASARKAEKAAAEAAVQRDEAQKQRDRADSLYQQEKARAERMQKQLGSPIVDDLK